MGVVLLETVVTNGLVLRQTNYEEAHRILMIFTHDLGIISAIARGARKYKSHQGVAAQFLCYSQFTLRSGSGLYTLQGASPIESFYEIGGDIRKLSLANYFCDITAAFLMEHAAEPETLRLLLNTLYILAKKERPLDLIKAVYELRFTALAGFGAELDACVQCGRRDDLGFFSAAQGGTVCASCAAISGAADTARTGRELRSVSETARNAMRYIMNQPENRIFAMDLPPQYIEEISRLAESFLLTHADRAFNSLEYYKRMMD